MFKLEYFSKKFFKDEKEFLSAYSIVLNNFMSYNTSKKNSSFVKYAKLHENTLIDDFIVDAEFTLICDGQKNLFDNLFEGNYTDKKSIIIHFKDEEEWIDIECMAVMKLPKEILFFSGSYIYIYEIEDSKQYFYYCD